MRITIKDIAKLAGVSKTTVSFAFNDPEKISRETRDRVLAIAADLGYVPDPIARTLITKRIGTIGLLLPQPIHNSMSNPYLTELIQGIGAVCHKHHFSLTIIPPARGRIMEAARNAMVDGLITIGVGADMSIAEFLRKRGLPFVTIDSIPSEGAINVGIDDEKAAYELMRYVLEMGHRRIAVMELESATAIHPEECYSLVRDLRMKGFERALAEKGLDVGGISHVSTECSLEGGHRVGLELLDGHRPQAVVAMADIVALGFYLACRDRKLVVPADVSVVGFDDIQMSGFVEPALTTIRQPGFDKGHEAGTIMFALIQKGEAQHRLLPSELIVRKSVARPR